MAVIWIDPSRGTGTTAGWQIAGTVTYDATKAALKCDSTGANQNSSVYRSGVINAAGGYLVQDIEFETALPADATVILIFYDAAITNFSYFLRVHTGGAVSLNNGTPSATGVIAVDTVHRIEMAWTITNTTTNRCIVWIDGVEIFNVTNLTLTSANTVLVEPGFATAPGANRVCYLSNFYSDSDTSLTQLYPDLWLEPRAPAGAGTNEFDTGIGSGTNRWDRVAEVPISETNGWREATPGSPATERMPPDAVLASANLNDATVANLDEDPDSGDANWATATGNTVATSVRTSFATPSITPAGTQEFRALVRKSGTSGTGTPTARLDLYENGSLVSSSSAVNVTSTTGQVLSYTWDMTGRTAALIEAAVTCTASGGGPSVRAAVDIGAVEWNAAAPAAGALETYALAGVAGGDVDLTGRTLVARLAWVWAKASAAGTAYLVDNGTETAISLTTTSALYTRLTDTASYPAGTDQIGLRAVVGDTDTDLYECGAVIAALVPAGNVLVDWTPTGGITFAGAATVERAHAASGSGGIVFAGAAVLARTVVQAVSGGVTLAGAATVQQTWTHAATGGVTLGGTAPATLSVTYEVTPSGGITLSGAATVAQVAVYTVTPSGGVTLSGAATVALVWVVAPAGGVVFGGTGSGSYSAVYTVTPDGGVTFDGTAAHELTSGTQEFTHTPTGGIAFSGAADAAQSWAHTPDGGVTFAGAAETAQVAVYTVQPSGGLDLAGTAVLARLWAITGTSGVTLAGTAATNQTWTHAPSGGITFAGSAPISTAGEFIYQPSGGVTFAGVGVVSTAREITPSGGIAFDGAATLARVHAYLTSGGLVLGGGADLATVRVVATDGGVDLAGDGLGVFVPLQLVFLSSVTGGDRAAVGVAGGDTSAVAVAGGTALAVGVAGGDSGGAAVAGSSRVTVSVRGGDSRP